MATFQVTTTARQDAAAARAAAEFNAERADPVTVLEFVRGHIAHLLNGWADRYDDDDRQTKAELYQQASAEDKAAIDVILDKYRT